MIGFEKPDIVAPRVNATGCERIRRHRLEAIREAIPLGRAQHQPGHPRCELGNTHICHPYAALDSAHVAIHPRS